MPQMAATDAQSRSDALLLNVGVKSIEQDPHPGMPDLVAQPRCIFGRVQKERLEPIERLKGKSHTVFRKRRPQFLPGAYRPLPFFRRSPSSRQKSNRGIHWP